MYKNILKYLGFIILITLSEARLSCLENTVGGDVKVFRNLGPKVNSKFDEFMPYTYNDTLYFRRNDKKNKIGIFRIAIDKYICASPKINEFKIYKKDDFQESKEIIDKAIQATPSVPIFFNYADSIRNWENPKALQYGISGEYNDLHPAIAPDGSFMVFVSDRPIEAGGERMKHTDLYISFRKKDGTWSEPKSLGKKINTEQNEITPYIAKDFTLYFASKGYRNGAAEVYFSGATGSNSDIQLVESKYNYDIIKLSPTIINGKVKYNKTPEKLPYPFNTEWDELGPNLYNDSLLISSNRVSSARWGIAQGGFDLYGWVFDECPCVRQCAEVELYGYIKGENIAKYSETKIQIFGADNKAERILLVDTIIGKELNYKYKVAWHNQYYYQLSQVGSDRLITKDTICFAQPCNFDTVRKVRADFVFNNFNKPTPKEECKDCKTRCLDYVLNIQIKCENDSLTFPGKLIIQQNGFEIKTFEVFKPNTFSAVLSQDDKRSDDIKVIFQSKGIPSNGQLEKDIVHVCNSDTLEPINVTMDLPESCCSNSCQFLLSGKLVCGENGYAQGGELIFISIKDGGIYQSKVGNDGKFEITLVQLNTKANYKVIYKNLAGMTQQLRFKHNCDDGDIKNYIFKLPEEFSVSCKAKINLKGTIKPDEYLCSLKGSIVIIDLATQQQLRTTVSEAGEFAIQLNYAEKYKVSYRNNCNAKDVTKYITMKNCPDNDVAINMQFELHNKIQKFDIGNTEAPLFVKGYWKLNSKKNLYELYERFDNPKFGNSIACGVTDPASDFNSQGEKINYWEYTDQAVRTVFSARDFVLDAIQRLECGCTPDEDLNISIVCYNSNNEIECNSIYPDETVNELGVSIEQNSVIRDFELAELRAFNIYKELVKLLQNSKTYRKYQDRINFGIFIEEADGTVKANSGFDIRILNENLTRK